MGKNPITKDRFIAMPLRQRIMLKGTYNYLQNNRGASGWVAAKIDNGALSCLRYHDFQNDCRSIRLPDVAAAQ